MELPEIEYLYNLRRFGMKLDLSIMQSLASLYNNPQNNFKSIHIAGTNGKGSVAAAIYSILRRRYSVGLYTSPHLVRFNERIIVNDKEIDDEYIVNFIRKAKPLIENLAKENRNPTFFEVTTLLAFQYFTYKNVDFGVLEVGLGGRLDATNIITPEISAIVTIDLDHTNVLGHTIESIAKEKAGIIKNNIPVVVGEKKEEAVNIIKKIAEKRNAPYHNIWDETEVNEVTLSLRSLKFTASTPLREYKIEVPLTGKHQITNMLVAIRSAEILSENFTISKMDIINGLKNIRWKDRFQVKMENPLLIFDSAHNPSAARCLVDTVKDLHLHNPTILFSMLSDKNINEFLKKISEISNKIIITEITYEKRRMPIEDIKNYARNYFESVIPIRDPCEALKYALANEKIILATGSIYLLGDLEKCLTSS